jgi:hypothetical protein
MRENQLMRLSGVILLAAALSPTFANVRADDAPPTGLPGPSSTWTPPAPGRVRATAMEWLAARNPKESTRRHAEQMWSLLSEQSSATDRFEALTKTFALGDARAGRLVRFCAAPRRGVTLPETAWLADAKTPALVSANLRLLAGRWLVQESLFDEAHEQLGSLKPEDVVDPASLLFYQSVAHHRLLHKKEGIETIDRLLTGEKWSPRRYTALAGLMREDLEGVQEETLDHIARRMEDIGRRLDLGRAGPKVRGIEDGVIKSLDKIIEELEKQQQQQSGSGNTLQPSSPAQDSNLMGGQGPGRVDRKKLGSKTGWGHMPPKKREEALQEIGRQFPSHYRDVIEQYFRGMATEEPAND